MSADEFFAKRKLLTAGKVDGFRTSFTAHLQKDGADRLANNTCVYAVGSAGRGEMTSSSDLDLFLVTAAPYKRVNEILAQAAVLRMMVEHNLPEPSNDAGFLKLHTAESLAQRLGDVHDDFSNTFTVRMLLLLESRPIYGDSAYEQLLDRVVNAYWRNEEGHTNNYLPMVLVNDIVRYWRVVLLNYEAKFDRKLLALPTGEDNAEAVAKVKNEKRFASYKLRFSRCMTCYSMLARLLAEATTVDESEPHISRGAMLGMVRSTPVQRLQQVRTMSEGRADADSVTLVNKLLGLYQVYLLAREKSDSEVQELLASKEGKVHFENADEFGEKMYQLINQLGKKSPLYRYVVA